jgi:hypothetical protein
MIRITVELVSAINPSRSRVLGVAKISNDSQLSFETGGKRGAYDVTLSKWAPKLGETWKRGRVENFDRVRRGPWDLLYLALRSAIGDRNPPGAA